MERIETYDQLIEAMKKAGITPEAAALKLRLVKKEPCSSAGRKRLTPEQKEEQNRKENEAFFRMADRMVNGGRKK